MKKRLMVLLVAVLVLAGVFVMLNTSSMELKAGRGGTANITECGPGNYMVHCEWDGGQSCWEVIAK